MFHDCCIHDIDLLTWVIGEFPTEVLFRQINCQYFYCFSLLNSIWLFPFFLCNDFIFHCQRLRFGSMLGQCSLRSQLLEMSTMLWSTLGQVHLSNFHSSILPKEREKKQVSLGRTWHRQLLPLRSLWPRPEARGLWKGGNGKSQHVLILSWRLWKSTENKLMMEEKT